MFPCRLLLFDLKLFKFSFFDQVPVESVCIYIPYHMLQIPHFWLLAVGDGGRIVIDLKVIKSEQVWTLRFVDLGALVTYLDSDMLVLRLIVVLAK